jgi:FkbM family methyltransferase
MALGWSDMSMFKRMALATVGRTPTGVRTWVYRHPTIWNFLAKMIGRMVPAGESTVVDVRVGPNAGLKLAIDQTTPRYYWLDPSYESAVVGVLNEWTKPGMCVADIGAHIGFMTMVLSRRVGSSGEVLSVEPSPPSVLQLRRNVGLNHLTNVKVIQAAISDATGEAQFSILPFATTSHIVSGRVEDSEAGATMVSVPLARLDDLVFGADGSGGIDVVKIDVEGHEGAVLRGGTRVINELRPKLLIEIHTPSALADCLKQLREARYEISTVTADEYYRRAISDPAVAERDAASFSINHICCLPI